MVLENVLLVVQDWRDPPAQHKRAKCQWTGTRHTWLEKLTLNN